MLDCTADSFSFHLSQKGKLKPSWTLFEKTVLCHIKQVTISNVWSVTGYVSGGPGGGDRQDAATSRLDATAALFIEPEDGVSPASQMIPPLQRLTLCLISISKIYWEEYIGHNTTILTTRDRTILQHTVESFMSFRLRVILAKYPSLMDATLANSLEEAMDFAIMNIEAGEHYQFPDGVDHSVDPLRFQQKNQSDMGERKEDWAMTGEVKSTLVDDLIGDDETLMMDALSEIVSGTLP